MLAQSEYENLRQPPPGNPVMYQRWRDLLFLHVTAEPETVQALLPKGLTVDTFPNADGVQKAWVGLVPFRMFDIHPRSLPSVPWLSAFPETNVRTYVHREGKEPGVWFFTLDAARWLACKYARYAFRLPYYHASMKTERDGDRLLYRSRRRERAPAELEIEARIGSELPAPAYGSLEFFLIERYLLYALREDRLFTGRVYHTPYPLRDAEVVSCRQSIVSAGTGISCEDWEHACFSEGLDVDVFGIEPLKPRQADRIISRKDAKGAKAG